MDGWKFNSIGCETLIGVCTDSFPLKHGNCFSVSAFRGRGPYEEVRIINFCVENLRELLRRGTLSLPVSIKMMGHDCACIDDERVPEAWYNDGKRDSYCTICAPRVLWTDEQKAEHAKNWEEIKGDDGRIIGYRGRPRETPAVPLKAKYAFEIGETVVLGLDEAAGEFLANYVPVTEGGKE